MQLLERRWLPFDEFISLRRSGKCNLGVSRSITDAISEGKIKAQGGNLLRASRAAYLIWTLVGYIPLILGIYMSFTQKWWAFIPGLMISGLWFNINSKSNQENLLIAAENDRAFYEEIRMKNGWIYEIDEVEYIRLKKAEAN